jgi:predicted small lipoprotein YifL
VLTACGHRGPLYLPGKSGDPSLDRQNRAPIEQRPRAPNDKPGGDEESGT